MKKIWTIAFIAIIILHGCTNKKHTTQGEKAITISHGLQFCEGTVAYGSHILVSNFGTQALNPLNNECKGYISIIKGDSAKLFIPVDGQMSGPKGMTIKDDYLYVADVAKMLKYNLTALDEEPKSIYFPFGNLYLNDIVAKNNYVYISVTNSGKIFKLDTTNPNSIDEDSLVEFASVPGANGLTIHNNTMYIASYPADGQTTTENVIYKIEDIDHPIVEKFIDRPGQYDGLAIYGNRLYFTNWVNNEVGYINLSNKEVHLLDIEGVKLNGPADITILEDKLYIPNLPSSQLVITELE